MSASSIIKFNKLSKNYGPHKGIENLNFTVQEGEIFGFLGPNGAGKTTTIRLMLDLLKPSSGSIEIFGKNVHKHSFEIRQKIGYLPGDFSPFDLMTGKQFLKFASRLRDKKNLDHSKLLSLFELSSTDLNKKIRDYSQGMKQKLGIIQAVVHEPDLIILDEPSTGLDPLMQDKLYGLLFSLNEKGSTIFFSSHNLPEVEKICQKVAIVKDAKLVGHETLSTLRNKMRKVMKVSFLKEMAEAPAFTGAEFLKKTQGMYEYIIPTDIGHLLAELNNLPVSDLIISEANLEDIFISYYQSENN